MCLLIAVVIFIASYNFYEQGYLIQAVMSAFLALIIFVFFTYRIVKNRRCFFGKSTDCNEKK